MKIYSVSEITESIRTVIENNFTFVQIEGEISNWRPSSAGHIYFTLKDSAAQIKAVIFRGDAYKLSFKPKDGDKVCCTGRLSVYAQQGSYQIIVSKMEQTGFGNILQMLEERKQKLYKEGLFDESIKQKLPLFPKTVGVVTSPTGAAIRDILNIAKRRNDTVNIRILPAIVQGDGAAPSIVKMIELANFYKLCDVLIIGRGGGSLEDLLPFSEESVVRAIAKSKIPTISAVGHEIDWALCDYCADKRSPTPSAAAEMAIPLKADIVQTLDYYKNEFYNNIKQKIEQKRLIIQSFKPENLEIRVRNIQQPLLNRYEIAKQKLYENLIERIKTLRQNINEKITILENASPQTILNRGYSMVKDQNGNIIKDSTQIMKGELIEIQPAKGKFSAVVS